MQSLVKQIAGLYAKIFIQEAWDGTLEFAFLANTQVTLHRPHF